MANNKIAISALIVSIVSIVIAGASFYFSYQTSYLHIEPELICKFYYSSNERPSFKVMNNGPVEISVLNIMSLARSFEKGKYNQIALTNMKGDYTNIYLDGNQLFKDTLLPKKVFEVKLNQLPPHLMDKITVFTFYLTYYRPSDMKKYEKEILFFYDEGQVYEHKDFINHEGYKEIMKFLTSVINQLSEKLRRGSISDEEYEKEMNTWYKRK
jgi:hypothetical protein